MSQPEKKVRELGGAGVHIERMVLGAEIITCNFNENDNYVSAHGKVNANIDADYEPTYAC